MFEHKIANMRLSMDSLCLLPPAHRDGSIARFHAWIFCRINFVAIHRDLAKAAEMRRKEEIRSSAAVFTSFAVVMLWLLAAVTASALVASYIPR
jgi:hypothetical protein